MPTIGVEDFLKRKSMTKLHLLHNLGQRVRSIKLIKDSGQPVGWWDTGWNLPEHQPNDFKGQTSCKIVLDTFHGNRRWRTPNRMCYGPWNSKKRWHERWPEQRKRQLKKTWLGRVVVRRQKEDLMGIQCPNWIPLIPFWPNQSDNNASPWSMCRSI